MPYRISSPKGAPTSRAQPLHRRALVWAGAMLLALAAGWGVWFWGGRQAQVASQEPLVCPMPAPPTGVPNPQPGMVWVPGGRFELGDSVYPEEGPPQSVQISGFWMDRTEVTNDDFAAFVQATGYITEAEKPLAALQNPSLPALMQQPGAVVFVMPNDVRGHGDVTQWWRYTPGANWRHPGGPATNILGKGAFPVVAVTVADARAYARWKGRDLPSEAQWEWAARAARPSPPPQHELPRQANTWQGLFPVVNLAEDGFLGLAPVGCYPANALGLFDMIGNVWELTADAWTPHPRTAEAGNAPEALPQGQRPGQVLQQVIKGGSFLCAPNYCMRYRAGARQPQDADLATSHLGFRTILKGPP